VNHDDEILYAPLRDQPSPIPTPETAIGWTPYLGLAIAVVGAIAAYVFVTFGPLVW
jgi:hypothetical protein